MTAAPFVPDTLDHVGIAVADLESATREYAAFLGAEPDDRERVESQGVEEVMFRLGDSYIQLLGALGPETPVGRFLTRHGEGMHHLAYRVSDVGEELRALREAGVRLIDEAPRPGSRGTLVAFCHPAGFRGVLVELVQATG